MEKIVVHPNYKGLYYDRDKDGKVNWVVTGKSPKGKERKAWWKAKCKKYNIPIQSGCYAKIARLLHPTGKHVCQCCGKERSIFYEYPSKSTAKKINKALSIHINPDSDEERAKYTIKEIVKKHCNSLKKAKELANVLRIPVPTSVDNLIDNIYSELVKKESKIFSPGAMSNSPDRFDGFHSYSLCCRTRFDCARHKSNMNAYAQDRRAYEEWADGDWNKANALMGAFRNATKMVCPKCKMMRSMTADHIGPISLGFCHTIHFAPMCKKCNSSKNNRFTKSDVDKLIALEKDGTQIVSWHSKYVWNKLKNEISNDDDVVKLRDVMNRTHKNILFLFFLIYSATGPDFLMRYLHPEYAMFNHRVSRLDLTDVTKSDITSKPTNSQNKQKLRKRYIRIAFESLKKLGQKKNRRVKNVVDEKSQIVTDVISLIKRKHYKQAEEKMSKAIKVISDLIIKSYRS